MREKIEFKKIPKGKEKDRLYYFPVSKNTNNWYQYAIYERNS